MDGLGREIRVSAFGDGDGIFEEIRAVEELRRVRRDTVVVGGPLPVRENVWGDSGGIRGDGECRGGGRRLANPWRGGCGNGLAIARVVHALEREQRQI